jgi:ribosome-associated protein
MIEIEGGILIPQERIEFRFSRSGGPGGQNVNKTNTRATLLFDAANCESITCEQRRQILKALATRTDRDGVIRVICQRYRTQKANREGAVERFVELLSEALKKKAVRKRTSAPGYARQRRLEKKKRRSILKQQRAEKSFEF